MLQAINLNKADLLSLAMALSLLPTAVLASSEGETSDDAVATVTYYDWTSKETETENWTAEQLKGGTIIGGGDGPEVKSIRLLKDLTVTVAEPTYEDGGFGLYCGWLDLSFNAGQDDESDDQKTYIDLDLQGHTLTFEMPADNDKTSPVACIYSAKGLHVSNGKIVANVTGTGTRSSRDFRR